MLIAALGVVFLIYMITLEDVPGRRYLWCSSHRVSDGT